MQVDNKGRLKQVIPLAGAAAFGAYKPFQGYSTPFITANQAMQQKPQPIEVPTPAPAPVNTVAAAGTPTAGPNSYVEGLLADVQGSLAGMANIPALTAVRTGKAPPAWQAYGGPIDIGFGMGSIPAPANLASVYQRMNPWMQEDILQALAMAGIPREKVLWDIYNATPGFRFNPQKAFNVA